MDRLNMAMADGGLLATSWWVLGRLLRLDVYYFLARDLATFGPEAGLGRARNLSLLRLANLNDLDKAGAEVQDILGQNSGRSPSTIINHGGAMYGFRDGASIWAQLNVQLSPLNIVDTPVPMQIQAPENTAFLSFLYTHPGYRGRGMARMLIAAASQDLKDKGLEKFMTHVSATNVPSLLTFKAAGWQKAGLIITRKNGKILWTRKLKDLGVMVSELPS